MTEPAAGVASSPGRPIGRPGVRRFAALVLAGVVGLVAGCAPDGVGSAGRRDPSGAIAAGLAVPPLDLDHVTVNVADHYRFADANQDVYAQVPCYCGCERSIGHRHLADCFVRSDGRGWDAHAAGCAVCIDESAMVRQLSAGGADATTVRQRIIAEFGTLAPTAIT